MRRLVIALLGAMLASPAEADEGGYQDLAWVLQGQQQFGMRAEIHMRAYIDGFRNGCLSMYVSRLNIEDKRIPQGNDAVEAFFDCLYLKDDSPTIYDRMIEAAEESPDTLVMTFLRKDFEEQCGEELAAVLELEDE